MSIRQLVPLLALVYLLVSPTQGAAQDRMAEYAARAERYAAATDAADAPDAGPEAVEQVLSEAVAFRAFLTEWLLDEELPADTATNVDDDRLVLTQHIVQLLSDLGRCPEASDETRGLVSTVYYDDASAAVEACRDAAWRTTYDQLVARAGEHGASFELVQHVLDGRARGVSAAQTVSDLDTAIVTAAEEWASAGECELLGDWLASIVDVPEAARDRWRSCASSRWDGQVRAARSRFAESRLAWRTDGGDANAKGLEVIETADALTTLLLAGLDESYTDVERATAELFETARIAVAASTETQHCEAGRAVVGTVERIERVHGARPDELYQDALTTFQEDCRPPRDRVRAAGVGLTIGGGALLAAGVAWDMAVMLGPEAERRRLQADCVGTTGCAEDEDIFDLSERVSRAQVPVAALYSIGATALTTGAVILVLKERQSRRRADALVWGVSPGLQGGSVWFRF